MKFFKKMCLGTLLLMGLTSIANADCSSPDVNYGKVARIYPHSNPAAGPGTFFTLKSGQTDAIGSGVLYYHISATNSATGLAVYQSTYDLLLEAARSGRVVRVRTMSCGTYPNGTEAVEVAYLRVDF